MAQASEQKLWPSRTTAWEACTSQVQRGQAQGTGRSGSHHNQLTNCCIGRKDDPRTNTPFPHTIHAKILITTLIPDKTPDQERRRLNQSKAWSIKTRKPQNKCRRKQFNKRCTFHQQDQFISLQTKHQDPKGANTLLRASIKRYAPSAQIKNNRFRRLPK